MACPGFSVAGSVLAGVGFVGLILYYRRKRKLPSSQIVDKELMISPSSKGLFYSPPKQFTRSIPSFPSLKSDLCRGSSYFGVQVFDYSELEQATNNFDPAGELGDGGFGTVYYGTNAITQHLNLHISKTSITKHSRLCHFSKQGYSLMVV